MEKKFYAVTTKCGHVGKGKFLVVTFPIIAESGKDAAKIARWMPRVKHHHKEAILDVRVIDYDEYQSLIEINNNNPYLQCKNVQEQNIYCPDIYYHIENLYTEDIKNSHMARVVYKQKKNKSIENDIKLYLKSMRYDYSFAIC